MTPDSLKASLTKTINIHEKPRVSLGLADNKSIPEYSDAELLSRVSQLLEKDLDLFLPDRDGDKNRWSDVLRLLCDKVDTIKGELNNVKKCNQTLSQQKMVCSFSCLHQRKIFCTNIDLGPTISGSDESKSKV